MWSAPFTLRTGGTGQRYHVNLIAVALAWSHNKVLYWRLCSCCHFSIVVFVIRHLICFTSSFGGDFLLGPVHFSQQFHSTAWTDVFGTWTNKWADNYRICPSIWPMTDRYNCLCVHMILILACIWDHYCMCEMCGPTYMWKWQCCSPVYVHIHLLDDMIFAAYGCDHWKSWAESQLGVRWLGHII